MANKVKIGPVQLIAIGFTPDSKFEGKILEELQRLDNIETIRILDLLFVKKDLETSELVALSFQAEEMGAIVGALMGFEFEGEQPKKQKADREQYGNAFGLSAAEIERIGLSLEPGTAAGIVLIEHVWARDLKQAIRSAGGVPIAEGFLTPEAIAEVAVELEAMTEAIDELKQEKQPTTEYRAYAQDIKK